MSSIISDARSNKDASETLEGTSEELLEPLEYDGIPEEQAWFVSRLFYAWMRPLFRRAKHLNRHGTALQQEDLIPLPKIDYGAPILTDFERCWEAATANANEKKEGAIPRAASASAEDSEEETKEKKTDRIRKALFGVMGRRFVIAGFIKALNTSLQFSFPLILNAILKFIEDTQAGEYSDEDPWYEQYRGYWLSAVLFGVMGGKALTENYYFFAVHRSGKSLCHLICISVPSDFFSQNLLPVALLTFQDTTLEWQSRLLYTTKLCV